jgi:hypothetical protein
VDYGRAETFLAEFQTLAAQANALERSLSEGYWAAPAWVDIDHDLQGRLQAAKTLAAMLIPGIEERLEPQRGVYEIDWAEAVSACVQLRGVIRHADELAAILGPVGPSIAASRLHPWVWEAAASAWDAGLRRAAVQAAAARIDHETQVKLRRVDIAGVDLARQAWAAADPGPGKPRLRPVGFGEPGSRSFTAALDGAREFHAGAMARIRNLATHAIGELDESEALEQLAALSVLARWIDAAIVLTK